MFKKLIAAALITVSLTTQAQNWVMIAESADNNRRVLVDSDSWTVSVDEGKNFFVAKFKFVNEGVLGRDLFFVTEATSCVNRNGTLWQREFKDNKWTTVNQYWWSKQGTKLYDNIGGALCDIFKVRVEESPKTPFTNSKSL